MHSSLPPTDLFSHDVSSCTPLHTGKWAEQMRGLRGLFVVATPIGHQEDISVRALTTLSCVDALLCEDTRVTRRLLSYHAITKPCYSFHAHNENQKLVGILTRLKQGSTFALVSDRGTPLISDPGFSLVRACFDQGIPVHAIPGASALTIASVLAGFPMKQFFFQGFLPVHGRKEALKALSGLNVPIVFFEAPHRLKSFALECHLAFGERKICLLRELSKKFEERIELDLKDFSNWAEQAPYIGECVVVINALEKPFERRVHHNKYPRSSDFKEEQ